RFVLDDGPPPGQVALGADAFLVEGRLVGEAVLLEAARPLPLPRRLRAVLAHVHADFFLLGHDAPISAADPEEIAYTVSAVTGIRVVHSWRVDRGCCMEYGHFRLLRQIGAGRDGSWYRAEDLRDGRPVEVRCLDGARADPARWQALGKRLW